MKLSRFQRRVVLGGALIATVAAAIVPEDDEVSSVHSTRVTRPARQAAGVHNAVATEPLPQLKLDLLAQPASREAVRDAFEERSWAPPPAKPAPPPPPQAPPLPFRYMGKIMDAGEIVVFLAKQDSNYVVRAGDKLDGSYTVDEIQPGMMTLTYLPLGQKQILAIGAAN